jgi:hypothetical protein
LRGLEPFMCVCSLPKAEVAQSKRLPQPVQAGRFWRIGQT